MRLPHRFCNQPPGVRFQCYVCLSQEIEASVLGLPELSLTAGQSLSLACGLLLRFPFPVSVRMSVLREHGMAADIADLEKLVARPLPKKVHLTLEFGHFQRQRQTRRVLRVGGCLLTLKWRLVRMAGAPQLARNARAALSSFACRCGE